MKKYSVAINAGSHEIFNFMTDREKFKKWVTHLEDIVPDDVQSEIGLGYKFTEKDSLWGIKKEFHDEVFQFEKDKIFGIRSEFKDKIVKFRYTLVPTDTTVKEKKIIVTPVLNDNIQEPEYYQTVMTENDESLTTEVILEVWMENPDGSKESLGEKALDYFLAKEGVRQLKKLKKLIEEA